MLVDLCQTTTADGLRLDGTFQAAASAPAIPVDAFCLVHGTGGNFYGSTLFDVLSERLLALGCGVLRVNTRGHDGISTAVTPRGGQRLGAAYEVVDDCRHDLAAWIDWLRQRAGPRVGLLGHSLGAVKCLYAIAQDPRLAPACVIALSPPRLAYSVFCQQAEFLETYGRAERLVKEGRPDALLEVTIPLPYAITAAGYVEKYGPDERYNFLRFLAGIQGPILVTYGSKEVESNLAFRGMPEAVQEIAALRPALQVAVIPGADHFYTGVRQEIGACVDNWLRRS